MKSGCSKNFLRALVLDLGYEPSKSQSKKIRISSFVNPSKIFVWEFGKGNFMLPNQRF